jgi:hypothetical protein
MVRREGLRHNPPRSVTTCAPVSCIALRAMQTTHETGVTTEPDHASKIGACGFADATGPAHAAASLFVRQQTAPTDVL